MDFKECGTNLIKSNVDERRGVKRNYTTMNGPLRKAYYGPCPKILAID